MAYTNIDKSSLHFNTLLYTGTGSTNAVTGVGFTPDMIWGKNRGQTYNHQINDTVRGVNKQLAPNSANAEETNTGELTAFGSDGFTLGTGGTLNGSGDNIVAWNWKANGQGSANSDGTITTTYTSANTTSGFSIVSFTGTGSAATVGHGLGVTPKMIILKNRSTSSNWTVYHTALTSASYKLNLDDTGAEYNDSTYWNGTDPTSSVFSVGTNFRTNGSGNNIIAYCFAEKKGFSKFGEYVGNGSATNGSFIYTGFKPAFVMVRRYSNTGGWNIMDAARSPFNIVALALSANTNNADDAGDFIDILSNGFKHYSLSTNRNGSGSNYLYMAFAEAPLVGSNNVPCTAR